MPKQEGQERDERSLANKAASAGAAAVRSPGVRAGPGERPHGLHAKATLRVPLPAPAPHSERHIQHRPGNKAVAQLTEFIQF